MNNLANLFIKSKTDPSSLDSKTQNKVVYFSDIDIIESLKQEYLCEYCVGPKKDRLFGEEESQFTWSWCTLSRPWFPQRQRAWPTLQEGGASQQFGSHGM